MLLVVFCVSHVHMARTYKGKIINWTRTIFVVEIHILLSFTIHGNEIYLHYMHTLCKINDIHVRNLYLSCSDKLFYVIAKLMTLIKYM